MSRISWILTRALKSLKICTFIGSYCVKYLMFDLKKYRGVIFHDTEDWCKIWRKTDLWFGKWHEEYGKFSAEHLKFSELGLWWDPLIQSKISRGVIMSWKWTMMQNLKSNKIQKSYLSWHWRVIQNLERNWRVVSKLTRGIWQIFDLCTWKSQRFSL